MNGEGIYNPFSRGYRQLSLSFPLCFYYAAAHDDGGVLILTICFPNVKIVAKGKEIKVEKTIDISSKSALLGHEKQVLFNALL